MRWDNYPVVSYTGMRLIVYIYFEIQNHSILKSLGAFNPNLIPHFGLRKYYVENASYVKDFEQNKVYLTKYRRKNYPRYKMPLLYMDSKYPIQQSGRFPHFHTENIQSECRKFNMAWEVSLGPANQVWGLRTLMTSVQNIHLTMFQAV